MSIRTQRIGKEIQRIISDLLLKGELHDPRFAGMISFTKVDVAPDIRSAKVFYSCLGDEMELAATAEAIESARGFIQSEVAAQLVIRYSPKLSFHRDDSIAYGDKIERMLDKMVLDDD
ncbi:MAG TPA: 30S ribosome-binding factor RbfA [candidate division Zixibacteria bacterium]|nr:30S ribosome-binding factor RbfA [candidate division Zixibacteria bacterium]